MFCTKCGAEIPEGALFCPNCGEALKKPDDDIFDGGDAQRAAEENSYEANDTYGYQDQSQTYGAQDPNSFYQQQYQPQPAPAGDRSGMAIASMVLGICAIVFAFLITFIGLVCGIVGLILARMSRFSEKRTFAKAGLIMSIIGLALAVLFIIIAIVYVVNYGYWYYTLLR